MILNEIINIIALIIFLVSVSIYGIKLIYGMKKPGTAKRGFLNIFYGLWVERVIDETETIIAIQTMRNLIMTATFLSSSMLLLLGLLIRIPGNGLDELLYFSATSTEIIAQLKLLLFVAVIIFSIIMFLLSLRQMVRFSILIGIPNDSLGKITIPEKDSTSESCVEEQIDPVALQRDVFLRAMNRFTFGIRAVFYGITIILWFISVYAFIIGTISLTAFLIFYQDVKTPCLEGTPI
jgi:uncharacterized membrane protein